MKKEQSEMLNRVVSLQRERRYFSEAARRFIVEEIDNGLSKAEAARKYEVSQGSIYVWVAKYSKRYKSTLVKVVEHASESNKVKKLEQELEQAYAMLGRVKAESMFLQKIIEKADEAYDTDLKKSFDDQPLQRSTTKKTKT
jgi:transposase